MDNEFSHLKIEDIIPNKYQPRESFNEKSLNELADSIKQHGVIQPIIVRKNDEKYEIIDGERRYKASLIAGLTKIPAIIRKCNDLESVKINLIDNLQRTDLSPIEEARAYKWLLEEEGITQGELANNLGKSQSAVANKIRLLNLPLEIQESLLNNEISERHARSLLTVKNEKIQIDLLKKIIENKMTVRELDSEIKNMSNMFIPEEYVNNNSNGFDGSSERKFIPEQNSFNDVNGSNTNQFINTNNLPLPNSENNTFMPTNNTFIPADNGFMNNNFNNDTNNMFLQPTVDSENNMKNNPFFTSDNFVPPMSMINSNEQPAINPFSSIRMNSNAQNQPFSNMNNESSLSVNPFTQEQNSFINSMNNENSNGQGFFNNGFNDNNINNNNNRFEQNNSSSFNIDDYKLPGMDYNEPASTANESFNGNAFDNFKKESVSDLNNYKYVEENPNYESVDAPKMLESVDDIIRVLQDALAKIKNSKMRVETEEIDFDDSYQIVIKIDKKGDFN